MSCPNFVHSLCFYLIFFSLYVSYHVGLRCKLRLYQRKALAWMLMRERGQVTGTKSQIQTHISQKSRHSHNGNDDRTGAIDNVQSNVRDTRTQEGWVDPRWRTLRLHVIPYHHFDIRAGNWAPLLWYANLRDNAQTTLQFAASSIHTFLFPLIPFVYIVCI